MLHRIQIASNPQGLAEAVNGHEGIPLGQLVMAMPSDEIMDVDPRDLEIRQEIRQETSSELEDEEVQLFFDMVINNDSDGVASPFESGDVNVRYSS